MRGSTLKTAALADDEAPAIKSSESVTAAIFKDSEVASKKIQSAESAAVPFYRTKRGTALIVATALLIIGAATYTSLWFTVIKPGGHDFSCSHDKPDTGSQARFQNLLVASLRQNSHRESQNTGSNDVNLKKRGISSSWEPMRIWPDLSQMNKDLASTPDLLDFFTTALLPTALDWFASTLTVRRGQGKLIINDCLRSTGTICTQRWDRVVAVLNSDLILPMGYTTIGVDADLVIVVASQETSNCAGGVLAYAGAVGFLDEDTDRPTLGYINFCPSSFDAKTRSEIDSQVLLKPMVIGGYIATVIHEMSHILAFSSGLYALWRDENNAPRTPRNLNGSPSQTNSMGMFVPSTTTLQKFTERGYDMYKLVTPALKAAAQAQFGCVSLNGVELQSSDTNPNDQYGSHLAKRVFMNEYMTATLDFTVQATFGEIGMALMKDSGWYRIDERWALGSAWGKNKGCAFATSKCITSNTPVDATSFCTASSVTYNCLDTSRVQCATKQVSNIPSAFQYFSSSTTGGSDKLADYCPYYTTSFSDSDCRIATVTATAGETAGVDSKCFVSSLRSFGAASVDSRCHRVKCAASGTTYELYVGSQGQLVSCGAGGSSITVPGYTGNIACPTVATVCPQSPCTAQCSSRGKCVNGVAGSGCVCAPGFGGSNCGTVTMNLDDSRAVLGLARISRPVYTIGTLMTGSDATYNFARTIMVTSGIQMLVWVFFSMITAM